MITRALVACQAIFDTKTKKYFVYHAILACAPPCLIRYNEGEVRNMDFKERMKGKRNKIGMTLEDVAKVVGVSRQTIQKYESGIVANIPSDKIELLAKALHTSPAYGLIAIWLTEKHKKRRGQTAPLSLYMY